MKYNLSIDIDKDKVTVVKAVPANRDNPLSLEYVATWPIPSDDNGISTTIKAILEGHNIRKKEVVVVASASARNKDAFAGKLYLPVIPLSEIGSAVMWEARTFMPFDPKESIFDYRIEGKVKDKYGVEKIAVFFASIKVKEARRLMKIIAKAGLIPIRLLHPFSAIGLFLKEAALDGTTILLDAGSTVSLLIYRAGQFEFEKNIDCTENKLDRMLTEAGVAEQELFVLKNEYGLLSLEDLSRLSLSEPPLGSREMRVFADELATNVRKALRQWVEEQPDEVVEKIYLIGSLTHLRNLALYLASKLNIETAVGDVNSLGVRLSCSEEIATPDLSLLIPAIGGSSEKKTEIELLPSEAKIQRKLTQVDMGVKVALSLIVGVVLLLSFITHIHFLTLRRAVDAKRNELAVLISEKGRDVFFERKKEELRGDLARYYSVAGDVQPIWAGSLREITNIIPEGVLFRKMRLDGEKEALLIDGIVVQKEAGVPAEKVLAQFVEGIEGSPFFANVSLTSIDNYIGEDAGGMPARSFSLRILLRRLPPEAF